MKYRTRSGSLQSDFNFSSDFSKGLQRFFSEDPSFFPSFIGNIFNYLIGVFAFISRSFLRLRLGERSFGLITIITVFPVVWLLFYSVNAYKAFWGKDESTNTSETTASEVNYWEYIPDISTQIYLFVGFIFILGAGHLVEIYFRRRRKIMIHSSYRGDSWLFGDLVGNNFFGLTINTLVVWMIIEPVTIYIFATGVDKILKLAEVAFILKISAVCLLIEEYRVYKETRKLFLEIVDGQLDAAYVKNIQETYKDYLEEGKKKYGSGLFLTSQSDQFTKNKPIDIGSDSKFRAIII
jgi:hypothetical protein